MESAQNDEDLPDSRSTLFDANMRCELYYGCLRADFIQSFEDRFNSGNGDLDDLKRRCSRLVRFITDQNVLEEVETVEQLLDALENQRVLGHDDVSVMKILAETTGQQDLEEQVDKYIEYRRGKF